MDKVQAFNTFWASFGLPAYDENTVPDGEHAPKFPYLTYSVSVSEFDSQVPINVSLWYRSNTWKDAENKMRELEKAISARGGARVSFTNGVIWFTRGSPFYQHMNDDSDELIKRIYVNVTAEFFTAE